ncbi:MAG: hypothetical protein JXJ19_02985 [Elusimicrobia bacterium]|nr:hypothetical protein [Elusimicrobiota bacterium]
MLGCFYLLTLAGNEYFALRLAAVGLLLFIKVLDYADGAIARAQEKPSLLGEKLDSFSDRPVRAGMILALFGYFSGNLFMIPYTVFLEWVIHQFGCALKEKKSETAPITAKRKFFSLFLDTGKDTDETRSESILVLMVNLYVKLFKSDTMHFIILPLIIALMNSESSSSRLREMSFVIIALYTSVMAIRFIGGVREYSGKQ